MTLTDWRIIIAIADRLEPRARREFLAAVATIRETLDIEAIAKAITGGNFSEAARLIAGDVIRDALDPLQSVIDSAFREAGIAGAGEIGRVLKLQLRFDVTNPLAVEFARNQAATLIAQVAAETEAAIRSIVARAFTEGLTWRETAQFIRPLIGLTARDAAAVLNYRDSLLKSGLTSARVDELVARYAGRKLRARANSIARTEIMAASNYGQLASWQQAIERGFLSPDVERKWTVTPDDRLCPVCEAMDGQVRKMSEAFQTPDGGSVMAPPEHTHCRCVVVINIRSA